jgi:hypothetical protein
MNTATSSVSPKESANSPRLGAATSSFALAAAVTVLFNTVLAWAKDSYAPLNAFMKSLTGHHWTTHGLADIAVFVGLGLIFQKTHTAEKMDPNRVISLLVWAVVAAGLGLALWYVFF